MSIANRVNFTRPWPLLLQKKKRKKKTQLITSLNRDSSNSAGVYFTRPLRLRGCNSQQEVCFKKKNTSRCIETSFSNGEYGGFYPRLSLWLFWASQSVIGRCSLWLSGRLDAIKAFFVLDPFFEYHSNQSVQSTDHECSDKQRGKCWNHNGLWFQHFNIAPNNTNILPVFDEFTSKKQTSKFHHHFGKENHRAKAKYLEGKINKLPRLRTISSEVSSQSAAALGSDALTLSHSFNTVR